MAVAVTQKVTIPVTIPYVVHLLYVYKKSVTHVMENLKRLKQQFNVKRLA